MKYVVFLLEIMLVMPLATMLREGRIKTEHFWIGTTIAIFLPTVVVETMFALYSWQGYSGHTPGFQLAICDFAILAAYLNLPKQHSPLPVRLGMGLYFLCVLASIAQAQLKIPVLFYAWQLLRIFAAYYVVARASEDPRVVDAIQKGLAIVFVFEAIYSGYQKLTGLDPQPNGTFVHQNYFGIVANLALIPLIARCLAGPTPWLYRAGAIAGAFIAVVTASRATLGLFILGAVLVFIYSLIKGSAGRAMKIGMIGLVLMIPMVPIGIASMQYRASTIDPYEDYDERGAFMDAAAMMVHDHPLGVGSNNFVIAANVDGYYDAAGVAPTSGSRSAHVHNIYYLTAAEIGYPGLAALLVIVGQSLWLVVGRLRKAKDPGLVLGGLGIGIAVMFIHSAFEWALSTVILQYDLAFALGMAAGTAKYLSRRSKRRDEPAPVTPEPAAPAPEPAPPVRVRRAPRLR